MNYKNEKENNNVKCPLCDGTGKPHERDDTDICGFDSENAVCPLCRGSGKVKSRRRVKRIHPRYQLKKSSLRKPRPGRGGRPSLNKVALPQPGTPMASYPEGDMIPKSREETDSVQQPSQFDIDGNGNVLAGQENLPQELPQSETIDKLEERISVLAECTDLFHGRPKGPPKSEQDIRALLQRAEALDIDPFFPLAPDDYRKGVLSNISGLPGTLAGPNEQLESPPSNATTPGALNQPDPLDVVGTPDPAVFPFNTDVEGNIGS